MSQSQLGQSLGGGGGGGGSVGGSTGAVQFHDGSGFGGSSSLIWDNTLKRLGVGSSSPSTTIHAAGAFSSGTAPYIRSEDTTSTGALIEMYASQASGAGYLQTGASTDIRFAPAGSTKMLLEHTTGNLGLGVTEPSTKLHLAATEPTIRLEDTNDSLDFDIRVDGNGFNIREASDSDAYRFVINGSTGNCGIGNSSPSQKLQITGSNDTDHLSILLNSSSDSSKAIYAVEGNTAGTLCSGTVARAAVMASTASGTALQLGTAGVIRATFDSSGNCGIGTSVPSSKLHLIGEGLMGNATNKLASYGILELSRAGDPYLFLRNTNSQGVGNSGFIEFYQKNGNGSEVATSRIGGSTEATHATQPSGNLKFYTASSGGSLSERMRISSDGNVSLKGGRLIIGEADVASGHIDSFENLTFNIDTDNDDSNRYFSFTYNASAGAGTEVLRIDEADGAITGGGLKLNGGILGHKDSDASSITLVGGSSSANTGANITLGGTSGSATREVIFKSNSTETMRIDSSGNVGIGTTSPSVDLHISKASNPTLRLTDTTNNNHVYLQQQDSHAYLFTGQDQKLTLGTNNNNHLTISTGSEAGFIGIGTTSPSSIVHASKSTGVNFQANSRAFFGSLYSNHFAVLGSAVKADDGTTAQMVSTETSSGNGRPSAIQLGAGNIDFHTATSGTAGAAFDSLRMRIDSSGNCAIGHSSPDTILHTLTSSDWVGKFESSDSYAAIILEDNSSTHNGNRVGVTGDNLHFTTAGTERARIDANGRLGIGENSPTETLHTKQTGFYSTFFERDNGTSGTQGWLKIGMSSLGGSGADALLDAKHSIGFRTNGTSTPTLAMIISDSQNVGIGSSSPSGKLEVNTGSGIAYFTRTAGDDGSTNPALGIAADSTKPLIRAYGDGLVFETAAVGGTASERMRIDSGGNVRVGNGSTITASTDADDLVIDKGAGDTGLSILSTTTGRIYFGDAANEDAGSIRYVHTDDSMRFETDDTERMRIQSDGTVHLPSSSTETLLKIDGNSATTKGIRIKSENAGGIIYAANSSIAALRFGVTADDSSITEAARFDSQGRLGLGTTVPNEKLVVSGNCSVTGALQITSDTSVPSAGAALYRPASNELGLVTASTERMRIASTGRVTVKKSSNAEVTALTDGATITPDLDDANNFSVTLGGNRTLANPSNCTAGQSGIITITQDGTGSRTLAYGAYWKFSGGTAPTLTTTASAVDVLAYYVESATRITATLISDTK